MQWFSPLNASRGRSFASCTHGIRTSLYSTWCEDEVQPEGGAKPTKGELQWLFAPSVEPRMSAAEGRSYASCTHGTRTSLYIALPLGVCSFRPLKQAEAALAHPCARGISASLHVTWYRGARGVKRIKTKGPVGEAVHRGEGPVDLHPAERPSQGRLGPVPKRSRESVAHGLSR